ncbi:receptor activity-modifying protein 1-like isoform X2 [Hippocampus comes]|uniref:receptor activity-modifying protein 1-like isoform X2 n=1 Tax=Hippocampus comes TaxID=109280 RepID=UPI00094EF771|nr:PREDICTED: receptor activity-modifying protein 1-like isoform X2 [Hippocampus comes]
MARLSLGVVIVAGLLCARTLQQTPPTDESVPEQTTVQNFSEPSGGWHRASTSVGKEKGSLSEDELTRVLDELEQEKVITEDDESFQEVEDLEPLRLGCRADALAELSVALCASPFEQQMATLEADARCVLDNIIGAYNELSVCLEELSHWCGCYYPNAVAHSAFLRVHSAYFAPCPPPPQEGHLEDAPRRLVLGLTLAPVALVPLLVYVVARRSGRTEPNAHR